MQADGSARPWTSTKVTEQLGIEYPVIQAPFGGLPSQRQTARVSNLGGLGSLGAVTLSGSVIADVVAEIRSLTAKPFAVNLWVSTSDNTAYQIKSEELQRALKAFSRGYSALDIGPPANVSFKSQSFSDQVRAAIDAGTPVLSFIYGVPPKEILAECRRLAITTIGTATTCEEAKVLAQAGLDMVVASGFEGGGHRGSFLRSPEESFIGGLSLIPQVVDAVDIPVIAAGGIADERGVAAALALGAGAVQIGTAFLACSDSGAGDAYRAVLLSETAADTALTIVFTGRVARAVRNQLMDKLTSALDRPLPFPLQHALTQTVAGPASMQQRWEWMTCWSGQSGKLSCAGNTEHFFQQIISKTDAVLSRLSKSATTRQGF